MQDSDLYLPDESGVDSSVLVGELLRLDKKFKSYSYGYAEKKYSELKDIAIKFRHEKNLIQNHKTMKINDVFDKLQKAIYFFETPLGGLGTLSSFDLFSKVNADNIKVCLSGEGADELFGGYKYYYFSWLKSLFIKKKFSELNDEIYKYNQNHEDKLKLKLLMKFFVDKKKMFAPDGSSTYSKDNFFTKQFKEISTSKNYNVNYEKDELANEIFKDIIWRKLPKLLHFQDRASMANSVESRVPFLDHELWDKAFSTNPQKLFNRGYTKEIMRKIYFKRFNTMPKTKKYVSSPQREWLKYNLKDKLIENIRYGKLIENKIINFEKWKKSYDAYSNSNKLGNSFFIWKILNAELLLKEFF